MEKDEKGYWRVVLSGIQPGTLYLYRLNGSILRPDPASCFQPEGVHGPSQVIDHLRFKWEDKKWKGLPAGKMIIYELHVGTFTKEGNFQAVIPRLDELKELGVNAIELMPVSQFPGSRNWGYDGAYPYAVQNSYGGPEGLKKLVDAAHQKGIAVILDVVYNHIGPEGNYFSSFGPYSDAQHKTPWGDAFNFDGAYSDEVRNFFIENALSWMQEFHVDALRLDAIHGIYGFSTKPFLEELAEVVDNFSKKKKRKYYLMAESDLNDVRVTRPRELGGHGIDVQWCDDFHHALHTLITGEKIGYYVDFGIVEQFVKTISEGFIYSWEYSLFRHRRHGSSSRDVPADQFIVFSQNHDQAGNRMLGERLSRLTSFEGLKLAAGAVMLSPYIPLIFMGEEYAEDSPFLYFVSHSNPELIKIVREGRRKEYAGFHPEEGKFPDPMAEETFLRSKLSWRKRREGKHGVMLALYRALIKLRLKVPALSHLSKKNMEVRGLEKDRLVWMRRWHKKSQVFCVFNFNPGEKSVKANLPPGRWKKILDSSDENWAGPGSSLPQALVSGDKINMKPFSFALYMK
jgi:maltooligosyltrehalose trehalohydrolase